MGLIPLDVKNVLRPKNTDVRLNGKQYYVYSYKSVWHKEKKKAMKISGPYVGKIILNEETDVYEFVPRVLPTLTNTTEVKTYGDFAFIDNIGSSLKDELITYYGQEHGTRIYVYSLLRILYGDKNSFLDDAYLHSYISTKYPDVAVSASGILKFIKQLGLHENTNKQFLMNRISKTSRILIFDGTTITYEADNAFSEYGRKAKKTNQTQAVEVKVYDTTSKEPVYYELVAGNVVDKTSFIQILKQFDVHNAIIIVDKGFNSKENIDYLIEHKINHIIPFNDNAAIIKKILASTKYTHTFTFNAKSVKGLKYELDNRFYYIFKDPYIAATQEAFYIKQINKQKRGYTMEALLDKTDRFGLICFVSNLNVNDIKQIYIDYKERWEIEVSVKLEKTSLENEAIRLHSTPGALGVRFLIQLEMIIVSRIYQKLKQLGLLEKMSIRETLKHLGRSFVVYKKGKWVLAISTKKKIEFLKLLDIQTTDI